MTWTRNDIRAEAARKGIPTRRIAKLIGVTGQQLDAWLRHGVPEDQLPLILGAMACPDEAIRTRLSLDDWDPATVDDAGDRGRLDRLCGFVRFRGYLVDTDCLLSEDQNAPTVEEWIGRFSVFVTTDDERAQLRAAAKAIAYGVPE